MPQIAIRKEEEYEVGFSRVEPNEQIRPWFAVVVDVPEEKIQEWESLLKSCEEMREELEQLSGLT